jgi:hypothetical protein
VEVVDRGARQDAPCELGPPLDHGRHDPARREQSQARDRIDPAFGGRWRSQDLDAPLGELLLGCGGGVRRTHHPRGHVTRRLHELAAEGQAQLGVEDHPQRAVARRFPDRGERVAGQRGRDAVPVTHLEAPVRAARRPSSDRASFSVT